ncbi:DinB family protein [Kribbella sandramycini]|uniref:DinB family protein n=1 Tax=Kribbella sandramycini TaxID=60450 RepID=A0A7Y4L4I0_9ACTN|nr:DinB family protein [Kribbella sandramycini]MBB6571533.1 putative damage-inducible protein DinB [Kribbella sandramycini]NOL44182.1 DinB family protein [Kribbella sandramycini]
MTNAQSEQADLLDFLGKHRGFLRYTAEGLTDEQANTASTVSALTIGGLIKHVTAVEKNWATFVQTGAPEIDYAAESATEYTPEMVAAWEDNFRLVAGETLADVLAEYEKTAAATDELVRTLDLNATYELPAAPWQPPGVFWSVRRVFLHITAETAQHAGHADIIREAIDGQKTMG